jgi:hypothetical protein
MKCRKVFHNPFPGNQEVKRMASCGGKLYIAVGGSGTANTLKVYRLDDPATKTWADVTPTLKNASNTYELAMAVFNGQLFLGTGEGEVHVLGGTGSPSPPAQLNGPISSMAPFNGMLHVCAGSLHRTSDGIQWDNLGTIGSGTGLSAADGPVLEAFGGHLYAGFGFQKEDENGKLLQHGIQIWRSSDGENWTHFKTLATDYSQPIPEWQPQHVHSMKAFGSHLYVGEYDGGGGCVYRTDGSIGSWESHLVTSHGSIEALEVHDGKLFAGNYERVYGLAGSPMLFCSADGKQWSKVVGGPVGSQKCKGVMCIAGHQGKLYFGTQDPANGGEVFELTNAPLTVQLAGIEKPEGIALSPKDMLGDIAKAEPASDGKSNGSRDDSERTSPANPGDGSKTTDRLDPSVDAGNLVAPSDQEDRDGKGQPSKASGVHGRVLALEDSGDLLGVVPSASIEFYVPADPAVAEGAGQVVARTTSDRTGYYKADLPRGDYLYRLSAEGYRKEDEGRGIQLQLGEGRAVYNFSLVRSRGNSDQAPVEPLPAKPPEAPPLTPPSEPMLSAKVYVVEQTEDDVTPEMPLPGAGVVLNMPDGRKREAKTDREGVVTFEALPTPGNYRAYAENERFGASEAFVVTEGGRNSVKIVLGRSALTGPEPLEPGDPPQHPEPPYEPKEETSGPRLHVWLADQATGNAITNAQVTVRAGQQSVPVRSVEPAGHWLAAPVPRGRCRVQVWASGYKPVSREVQVQAAEVECVIHLARAGSGEPSEPGGQAPSEPQHPEPPYEPGQPSQKQTVHVRVVDGSTGASLDGAGVVVGWGEFEFPRETIHGYPVPDPRDRSGVLYRLELANKNYWMSVRREGYRFYRSQFDLRNEIHPRYVVKLSRASGSAPGTPSPPDHHPGEKQWVDVRVVDARSQRGVPSALVTVMHGEGAFRQARPQRTNDEGHTRFLLPHGSYWLGVSAERYRPGKGPLAVPRRSREDGLVLLTPVGGSGEPGSPPPDQEPRPKQRVDVRVVDARSGRGVPSALVTVMHGEGTFRQARPQRTNGDGHTSFLLPHGSYWLAASAERYRPGRGPLAVPRQSGEDGLVRLALVGGSGEPGSSPPPPPKKVDLTVGVFSARGTPIAGAQVHVAGPQPAGGPTGHDGRWSAGLKVGTYTVTVSKPAYHSQTRRGVVLREGHPAHLRFDLTGSIE